MKYFIYGIRILFFALFIFLILNGKMMLWLALFAVSLIAALIFGRVYCCYACPMNTLMVPTEWLSKKLKFQTAKTPKWLSSGKFAWLSLVISIAFTIFDRKVLHKNLPILLIWLAASVLITLRYKQSIFHNLVCPFGVLQKVFGKFALLSKRVNKQGCIGCKICEKVCPTEAIIVYPEDKKAGINTTLCLQCTNCQQVCPKNTIHYSKKS